MPPLEFTTSLADLFCAGFSVKDIADSFGVSTRATSAISEFFGVDQRECLKAGIMEDLADPTLTLKQIAERRNAPFNLVRQLAAGTGMRRRRIRQKMRDMQWMESVHLKGGLEKAEKRRWRRIGRRAGLC